MKGEPRSGRLRCRGRTVQNPIEQRADAESDDSGLSARTIVIGGASGHWGGGVVNGGGVVYGAEKPKARCKSGGSEFRYGPTDALPFRQAARLPRHHSARWRRSPHQDSCGTVPADPETQPQCRHRLGRSNTPAALGISPCPGIHCRNPPSSSNQAESAGVPVVDQQAPLSGNTLPASDGRAPFVIAGKLRQGPSPASSSCVYPETSQRITNPDRSRINLKKEPQERQRNRNFPAGRTGQTRNPPRYPIPPG